MASTARLRPPLRTCASPPASLCRGPSLSRPMHDPLHYYVSCVNMHRQERGQAMTASDTPADDVRERILSAAELACAAWIVIGHNVLRILPNEVPILAVIAL